MRFATIATPARLPQARVLAAGLVEHHPDAGLTLLVVGDADPGDGAFDVLRPEELGVPGWEPLLAEERWADLVEFLRPHLLNRLIGSGAGAAVYLDVATDVVAPLQPVRAALERSPGVIVPGGGLIGLSQGDTGLEFLGWLTERLTRAAAQLPPRGTDADPVRADPSMRRWLHLAPLVFPRLEVIDHPGVGVSLWNLEERPLRRETDGALTAGGRPLRSLWFEGFDPARPWLLTAADTDVRVSDSPVLGELTESYAARLVEQGWRDARRRPDVGAALSSGTPFDDRLSHLLGDAGEAGQDFGDVFTPEGEEAFMRWLEEPSPDGFPNRYLRRVWQERRDVMEAYPDPRDPGFAGWAWAFGRHEMNIPDRFMPPRPAGVEPGQAEEFVASRPPLPRGPKPPLSMNVMGLLTRTLGLGEAARGYVRALQAAGVPVSTTTVDVRSIIQEAAEWHDEHYGGVEYEDLVHEEGDATGFNLVCINPDELPELARALGPEFFLERPSIGVWAWETDRIPERWQRALPLMDEIWVYSNYVAENVGRVVDVPVTVVPPPVSAPPGAGATLDLELPEGFRFLFMFDFFSTIQRKNPVGLIRAFRGAFEPGEGPQLIIKTINGRHRPAAVQQVLWEARGRPDIQLVDLSLSPEQRDALLASCDCYVSLHRSEGFGLTLAECMAMGKPVIGTNFSATTDFMTEENSYPVPHEMTRVGADVEIYPADGTWAEPDVDEAARLMRRVYDDPAEARAKGERARRDIEAKYAPRAIGERMRDRMQEVRRLWDQRATGTSLPS